LNGATLRLITCDSTVEVISALVCTRTSPLSVSTMREAVRRPTSNSARTGIFSTFASSSFSSTFAVSGFPAGASGSLWRGALRSSAGRAPTWASALSFTQALPSSNDNTSSVS